MDAIVNVAQSFPYLHAIVLALVLGSAFNFVVGATLATGNSTAMRFVGFMNGWISVRKAMRPLMTPHFVEPVLMRHPAIVGTLLAIAGAVSVWALSDVASDTYRTIFLGDTSESIAVPLAAAMKWSVLGGNGLAVIIGLLMIVAPGFWSSVESVADSWYSLRKGTLVFDKMHTGLDGWILAHPTAFGITFAVLGLGIGIFLYTQLASV